MENLELPERKAKSEAKPKPSFTGEAGSLFLDSIIGPGRGTKKNRELFENRLSEILLPNLSAKELVEKIVSAALEIEFGPSFTLSKGFGKMVGTIADAIVTNPELRRQALAVASHFVARKMGPREYGGH